MKILVVDDEFVSLNKLTLLLTAYGDCTGATNGEQALDMFIAAQEAKAPYDLITMDIDMPGMSGQEVVEKIRRWELDHGISSAKDEAKILMVTAMTDGKNIMSSFRRGCEGYITKPFDNGKIEQALHDLGFSRLPKKELFTL